MDVAASSDHRARAWRLRQSHLTAAHCRVSYPARRRALTIMTRPLKEAPMKRLSALANRQKGAIGYILLWLIGVPIPVLLVIFLLRGCT
jgi:hypothetical protein